MPNQAISPAAGLTADQIDRILNQMADSFGQQRRFDSRRLHQHLI
jgi:hypothetical protein